MYVLECVQAAEQQGAEMDGREEEEEEFGSMKKKTLHRLDD